MGRATTTGGVLLFPTRKRPGALRELSPQQSTGPNQPRGWLSKQCARKLAEFQQPRETVNRSLLGVQMERPRRCVIREPVRRGLTLRSEDPRAVRLLPQQVRRLTCSASELKRNCHQKRMQAKVKNAIRLPTTNPAPSPLTSSDILAPSSSQANEAEAEGVPGEWPRSFLGLV